MQHERHENSQLRLENERLRIDNMRYKEALNNAACPACGGPTALAELSFEEHQLRIENSRLRDEVSSLSLSLFFWCNGNSLNLQSYSLTQPNSEDKVSSFEVHDSRKPGGGQPPGNHRD